MILPVGNAIKHCALLLAIVALVSCGGAEKSESGKPSDLPALFPSDGLPENTEIVLDASVYNGRQLYDLINGGADIFLEFGCEEAAVTEYVSASGVTIMANIYRMEDAEAAFGMFSINRRLSHRPASMGTIGARGDYQVLFCAGEYFVDVQAVERDSVTAVALDRIAEQIEVNLDQEPNEWPDVLSLLPRRGLIAHTEAYIEGPIGLNARRYVSDENVFAISDSIPGALGSYRMRENSNPASFLVVQYPDSSAAAEIFGSISEFYQGKAEQAIADSAEAKISNNRIVYTHADRMDVVILRTTQITALFDQPGSLHGAGEMSPHGQNSRSPRNNPHGMMNPHVRGMPGGSGSKQ